MSVSGWSDLVAQLIYPATFIVCSTWVAIAVAHATNGGRLCYSMLALSMAFAAVAFGLLGANAGRGYFTLPQILILFRASMALSTAFGAAFTVLYLWSIRKRSKRDESAN